MSSWIDRVWSLTVEIRDYHCLENFISISLYIEIVFNDAKPCFSSHHHTMPPKDVTLSVQTLAEKI